MEITTGGQRLHRREELEQALRARGIDPGKFESHLRMFDLGMPPHGGFAIGLERSQPTPGDTLSRGQNQLNPLMDTLHREQLADHR